MTLADSRIRNFAKQVLSMETKPAEGAAPAQLAPVSRVCEKLRASLAPLVGSSGFRALLARALILSDRTVPWLKSVHEKPDGTLEGMEEIRERLTVEEIFRAAFSWSPRFST